MATSRISGTMDGFLPVTAVREQALVAVPDVARVEVPGYAARGGSFGAPRLRVEWSAAVRPSIRQLERLQIGQMPFAVRGNGAEMAESVSIRLWTMRNGIREYGLPPRRYA